MCRPLPEPVLLRTYSWHAGAGNWSHQLVPPETKWRGNPAHGAAPPGIIPVTHVPEAESMELPSVNRLYGQAMREKLRRIHGI